MSQHESFQVFYQTGAAWARVNEDLLAPFKGDMEQLEAEVREIFNSEGFVETVFQSLPMRLSDLLSRHPDIVERNFVDGVCDTIGSD
jgi:hypothetical protein